LVGLSLAECHALRRCYVPRVEIGHTGPAVETIEKFARALEVPIYQLFYDGDKPPELPNLSKRKTAADIAWGTTGKDARFLTKLRRHLASTAERDRKLLLAMAQKIAAHKVPRARGPLQS
jgi:transcriptional regulator with XRE-family HTH domain